jgi:hypothetical protein
MAGGGMLARAAGWDTLSHYLYVYHMVHVSKLRHWHGVGWRAY